MDVVTTFLGAHALPPEYADDRTGYVALVCEEALPEVHKAGLADAVDAFCETIAFTVEETAAGVRCRAGRSGCRSSSTPSSSPTLGGARLAARYGALSCDHLEYLDEDGVVEMARAGTVATLLPGAFYYLQGAPGPAGRGLAPARRAAGGGDRSQSGLLAGPFAA